MVAAHLLANKMIIIQHCLIIFLNKEKIDESLIPIGTFRFLFHRLLVVSPPYLAVVLAA